MLRETTDHEEDLRLVRGASRGDSKDVDELLRRLRCVPVILTARNNRLGQPLDATLLQDVAQDVLVAIWDRLERFSGASSLEAWVYRFCVHKHLAAVRNRGRRTRIEAIHTPALEGALAPDGERETDEELVHLALDDLESKLARVVQLKHFEDLTFEAVAERLDMSPNTAKTQYYRALGKMRAFLARRGRSLS